MQVYIRAVDGIASEESIQLSREELGRLCANTNIYTSQSRNALCWRAIDAFEDAVRSKSALYKCYSAWEITSISVGPTAADRVLSFPEFGKLIVDTIEENNAESVLYLEVNLYMQNPRGFDAILNDLNEFSPHQPIVGSCDKCSEESEKIDPNAITVSIIVESTMKAIKISLPLPLCLDYLFSQILSDNSLGGSPFDLYFQGERLSTSTDLNSILTDGDILFYRVASYTPVFIGILGFYREFKLLLPETIHPGPHGSATASMAGLKKSILRDFGVVTTDSNAARCVLRSADGVVIDSLDAFERQMDLTVPGAVVVQTTVYAEQVSGSDLASYAVDAAGRSIVSPAASIAEVSNSYSSFRNSDPNRDDCNGVVILLREWSWNQCRQAIGTKLFGRAEEKFDCLDNVDVISNTDQLIDGMMLIVRRLSGIISNRFFNYKAGNLVAKAGSAIPVSAFPIKVSVLFDELISMLHLRPEWKFKLYIPSGADSSLKEIFHNTVINVPKSRVTTISVEPVSFIIVNFSIDPTSYAMLDDLLIGVMRSRNYVCLAHNVLADEVLCLRDISLAFGLPSSVTIGRIRRAEMSDIQASGSGSQPSTPSRSGVFSTVSSLMWESFHDYVLELRQSAPLELVALSEQFQVPEGILQQLWNAHCSLEEIAWVLGESSQNLSVDDANSQIIDRRERRIPNDILLAVECQGPQFSVAPQQVIRYVLDTFSVAIRCVPGASEPGCSRWFFMCETPETANMLYQCPPEELVGDDGARDIVIFLAPYADDALYDSRYHPQRVTSFEDNMSDSIAGRRDASALPHVVTM